uniref:Uncharacterized protein n=1 Tax=Arundo donax TaxID=35708 RepID=A0A0A9CGC0_ARUDO
MEELGESLQSPSHPL